MNRTRVKRGSEVGACRQPHGVILSLLTTLVLDWFV